MKTLRKSFGIVLILALISIFVGILYHLYSNTEESINNDNQQRATITVLSPLKNEAVSIGSPMEVTWETSSNFIFPQVTITVMASSNNQAAFDPVTVPNTGSAMIDVPKNIGVIPYKLLIQATPYDGEAEPPFTYSDEFFFTGGLHPQMMERIEEEIYVKGRIEGTRQPFDIILVEVEINDDLVVDSGNRFSLLFSANSECSYGEIRTFSCADLNEKWGYGDWVRIYGVKEGNAIQVTKMEIVSRAQLSDS